MRGQSDDFQSLGSVLAPLMQRISKARQINELRQKSVALNGTANGAVSQNDQDRCGEVKVMTVESSSCKR